MKTINLKCITPPENHRSFAWLNKYSVFVNFGLTCTFSSKKNATLYQNALNDWLNDCIYRLNEHFITANNYYRRLWLFFDFDNTEERKIVKELSYIENTLNQCFSFQAPGAGFSNIMRNIENCANTLLTVMNYLEKKQRTRNAWEQIKLIQFERNRIRELVTEINSWPAQKYKEMTMPESEKPAPGQTNAG